MKKLFSLSLAIIMVVSLLCVPAHASSAMRAENAAPYYLGEDFCPILCDNEDGTVTVYENRALSSAQKLSTLLSLVAFPIENLAESLDKLREFINYDALYEPIRIGAKETLASYLSEDTLNALSAAHPEDTYQLMKLMLTMPEYSENTVVKNYVDGYLEWAIGMPRNDVGWALGILTGVNRRYFDEMEFNELTQFADDIIATDDYQTLLPLIQELRQGETKAYALACRYTAEELDAIWYKIYNLDAMRWHTRILEDTYIAVPVGNYPSEEAYYQTIEE